MRWRRQAVRGQGLHAGRGRTPLNPMTTPKPHLPQPDAAAGTSGRPDLGPQHRNGAGLCQGGHHEPGPGDRVLYGRESARRYVKETLTGMRGRILFRAPAVCDCRAARDAVVMRILGLGPPVAATAGGRMGMRGGRKARPGASARGHFIGTPTPSRVPARPWRGCGGRLPGLAGITHFAPPRLGGITRFAQPDVGG